MSLATVATDVVKNRLGILPHPGFITYFVTLKCNHRCGFCDVWKREVINNGEMSFDDIRVAFSKLKPVEVLRISGGEPFLRPELAEIVNFLDQQLRPGTLHFTTNGFLTDKTLADISKIKSKKKLHIKVSIDNVGERHDEIRGIKGAYDHAMETVRGLSAMARQWGFHVGINMAIVTEKDIASYAILRDEVSPLGVTIYPVIAHQTESTLYDDGPQQIAEDVSYKPINNIPHEALTAFIRQVMDDSSRIANLPERLINNYQWQGLYNRLVKGVQSPNPRCVAVRNHMRIMPNGDIPTCLYNKTVIGNLVRQSFEELWHSIEAEEARAWVARCAGCWQSCETGPSAIYTGDIVKGLRFRMDEE